MARREAETRLSDLAHRTGRSYISLMLLRKRARPPGFIEPCLPSPGAKLPVHGAWLHEVKIDGYRLLARRDATGVRLFTRHATDWTARFPVVAAAIAGRFVFFTKVESRAAMAAKGTGL